MSKRFRNPATGEVVILEEEVDADDGLTAKKPYPQGKHAASGDGVADGSESSAPEEPSDASAEGRSAGRSWTPFDFLDEIDGKDVEKLVLGAALGIGGVLAVKGLSSLFGRN